MGFLFECRFLVPEENVSFSLSSWRPADGNGSCVSVDGGRRPEFSSLLVPGFPRGPSQCLHVGHLESLNVWKAAVLPLSPMNRILCACEVVPGFPVTE